MKATPLSAQEYFPAYLSNGKSSLLLDNMGSHYNHKNGHWHGVLSQGLSCGWSKVTHTALRKTNHIQPVARGAFQVVMHGAQAVPTWFEQEMLPQTATLKTHLKYAGGFELDITNFLNDDDIWCMELFVTDCPDDLEVTLGFVEGKPMFSRLPEPVALPYEVGYESEIEDERTHKFTYKSGDIRGGGFMRSDIPYDTQDSDSGVYKNVKQGFRARRMMCCLDESDGDDWKAQLDEIKSRGFDYDELYKKHCERWAEKFGECTVDIPDKNIEYLYYLSRYVVLAAQHPKTGGLTTGTLPHLWGGGLYCAPDAQQHHMRLLSSGNIEAGRKFIQFYLNCVPANKARLKSLGYPGMTISGWDDCFGQSIANDFVRFVTGYKPFNAGMMISAIYFQWCYDPDILTEEMKDLIRDVLVFWDATIIRRENGKIWLGPVEAADESGVAVEIDTFIQMSMSNSLLYAGQMLGDDKLIEESKQLLEPIEKNRVDGILMPYTNAPHTSGMALWGLPHDIPVRAIDTYSMDENLRRGKTHWGYQSDQTSEEARHWSWYDSLPALGYARRRDPDKAMQFIHTLDRYTSSLGALFEYWTLEGRVIGYWYTTPHAIAAWAVNDALAHSDSIGDLRVLYGINKDWSDFKAENIPQFGGYTVSLEVKNGELTKLKLTSKTKKAQKIKINVNPMFASGFEYSELVLEAESTFLYEK